MENPSYDVDPKWADLVKERGNLPHELLKRLPGTSSSSDRKQKGPGRPQLLNSPPETPPSSSAATASPFSSLTSSTAGTSPFSSSLLNNPLFDPKNNPLFKPLDSLFDPKSNPFMDKNALSLLDPNFSKNLDMKNNMFDPKNLLPFGLPNMGALGGLGNPMNLFANLASLGLPSLAGLDSSGGALSQDQPSPGSSGGSKGKGRKDSGMASGKNNPPVSSASQLPFYFPNPSLLYSPLGLGGLNPFSIPPSALSSAYDSLAQQCNLLNGGGRSSRGSGDRGSSSSKLPMSSPSPSSRHRSSTSTSAASSSRDPTLQHLLLPPDTQLLDSLGRKAKPDAAARTEPKRNNKDPLSTQSLLMGSLSEMDDRMLRRLREGDMKEALEALSRSSAEFLAKSMGDPKPPTLSGDITNMSMADLLSRNDDRPKEFAMKEALALSGTSMIEVKHDDPVKKSSALFTDLPDFPSKREVTPEPPKKKKEKTELSKEETKVLEAHPPVDEANVDVEDLLTSTTVTKVSPEVNDPPSEQEVVAGEHPPFADEKQRAAKKQKKKPRTKSVADELPACRKNLRSSASRQERAAREAESTPPQTS